MKLLSELLFAEFFASRLVHKVAGLKIAKIEGLEIQTEYDVNSDFKHFLDNAYKEYLGETEELEEIITRYLNTSNSLYFKSDENININDILPVIKDYRFVAHLKEINPDFEQHIIFEKYNEELFIFYVEDSETNISYLNKEDLATLNISFTDLKSKAIENLENSINIERHGEEDYFMLTIDGNYETSLILLDIWSKDNFPVKGNLIIGIPARDVILITGSEDEENLLLIRERINHIFQTGDHLVSDKIFEFVNRKFEIL